MNETPPWLAGAPASGAVRRGGEKARARARADAAREEAASGRRMTIPRRMLKKLRMPRTSGTSETSGTSRTSRMCRMLGSPKTSKTEARSPKTRARITRSGTRIAKTGARTPKNGTATLKILEKTPRSGTRPRPGTPGGGAAAGAPVITGGRTTPGTRRIGVQPGTSRTGTRSRSGISHPGKTGRTKTGIPQSRAPRRAEVGIRRARTGPLSAVPTAVRAGTQMATEEQRRISLLHLRMLLRRHRMLFRLHLRLPRHQRLPPLRRLPHQRAQALPLQEWQRLARAREKEQTKATQKKERGLTRVRARPLLVEAPLQQPSVAVIRLHCHRTPMLEYLGHP
mmetsp:Transcript_65137/g.157654  ORF Transcript_65137/g.157654 Transcript_65137/m.157654 type:complete len:339 (-) Transcript_65137:426-1442(-)